MLLPVVDRPIIQYAVEEVVRAGVTNICIVISRGSEAIADHFSPLPELESFLAKRGKSELLGEIRALHDLADIYYVRQDEALGLGDAVSRARDHIGEEPFIVALPDEIYDAEENVLGKMIEDYDRRDHSVIAVTEVPPQEIHLYGSIDPGVGDEVVGVNSVVEKPDASAAPSNLAVIGRYVLHPEVFETLEKIEPGAGGEIQLTDGLNLLAANDRLSARLYRGRRWDAGKKESYLEAVVILASERPDLGPAFKEFLRGLEH